MHTIFYSPRAAKSLKKIPKQYQINIKNRIEKLSSNPRIPGTIKLDDYLFDSEIAELEKHDANDSWIKVDLKSDPDFLGKFAQGSDSQAIPS